ncbi:MAG: DUF5916 domain-containing protein, partial [Myxococcales bacterium]
TTLRVLYDDQALYIAFDCQQSHSPVEGRLTRRDEDSESDWVWVHIDSRRDARTAYFFAVNVKGVLSDGIMHDGANTSFEWDENWEARTAVTARGWSAEMRIPLRVLRFTPGMAVQDWGLWASRFIAVSQEKDDWPHIRREVAAPIPFFGRLDGLRELPRGGVMEVRPFVLGRGRYRTANDALVNRGVDGDLSAGLDLKLHLTQSLTLDAALNPDFAQVEADQLIFNLNNYEIQYPEKRPLFLEGADLFTTPLGIFYSRRIGSSPVTPTLNAGTLGETRRLVDVPAAATIYGALKLVGRFGDAWTVGLLSALAERNVYDVQSYDAQGMRTGSPARQTVEPLTAFNVLRVRREVGDRAQIGVIGTATTRFERTDEVRTACPTGGPLGEGNRCFRDAVVGGVDAVWRSPAAEYVASGQLVAGAVKNGPVETQLDGTPIGTGDRGTGGWARLAKDGGRLFLTEAVYTGISRKLTYNDLGFMPRQNMHDGKLGFELRSLEPGGWTLERHARLDLTARRDLGGLDLGTQAELAFWFRSRGFWNFRFAAVLAPAKFDDREVGDGTALQRARYAGGKVEFSSDPRARLGGGLKSEVRLIEGGSLVELESPLVFRVLPQFAIDLTPRLSYSRGEQRYAHNTAQNDPATAPGYIFGRLLGRSVGATLHVAYTFTPQLSLQTFAQLFLDAGHFTDFRQAPRNAGSRIRSQDLVPVAAAPRDADFEDAALNVNVVLRWEYRLGSTFFLVYSRSQVPGVALGTDQADLRLSAIAKVPAVDTILAKLSFWWAS